MIRQVMPTTPFDGSEFASALAAVVNPPVPDSR